MIRVLANAYCATATPSSARTLGALDSAQRQCRIIPLCPPDYFFGSTLCVEATLLFTDTVPSAFTLNS